MNIKLKDLVKKYLNANELNNSELKEINEFYGSLYELASHLGEEFRLFKQEIRNHYSVTSDYIQARKEK
jgi:hypothetical protein